MKFYVCLAVVLSMVSVAQADIMWRLADVAIVATGAIPPEKVVKSDVSPMEAGSGLAAAGVMAVGGVAGYNMAMTRYQANEILNTAAMLAILAMSADGGQGKKMTLAEAGKSGVTNEICNIDMVSDEKGMVTVTFGEDCVTNKGEAVRMKAVQKMLQEVAGDRVSCAGNECSIEGL